MNMLVILGHPTPGSLNHSIAAAAVAALEDEGHEVTFHDLCAEGFDPVLPDGEAGRGAELPPGVRAHCADLVPAEGIVVVHPNWWGMPPAVLKGWIDRVVRVDVAYRFAEGDGGEGVPVGLLRARRAVVFNTANTPAEREMAVFGDPLDTLWKNCVFGLCGVEDVHRRTFGVVCLASPSQRERWLEEVDGTMRRLFPRRAPGAGTTPTPPGADGPGA